MHILLTNDDGIQANGLQKLRECLERLAKVTVVAPDRERSGAGCSTSIFKTVCCIKTWSGEDFLGYSLSGTPVDCVVIGLEKILSNDKPDLLVAGINSGPNLGKDIFYSGTVGAALEGAFHNLLSLAISIDKSDGIVYNEIVEVVELIIKKLPESFLIMPMVLNINFPGIPTQKIKGFKLTKPAFVFHHKKIKSIYRTEQEEYFWIAGSKQIGNINENSDYWAVQHNYISITPISVKTIFTIGQDQLEKWVQKLNS